MICCLMGTYIHWVLVFVWVRLFRKRVVTASIGTYIRGVLVNDGYLCFRVYSSTSHSHAKTYVYFGCVIFRKSEANVMAMLLLSFRTYALLLGGAESGLKRWTLLPSGGVFCIYQSRVTKTMWRGGHLHLHS